MIRDAAVRLASGRGNTEEDLLSLLGGPPQQLADDSANYRQAMRLMRVEHAVGHRPAGFHMKDFGEFLGLVAGNHDVGALHLRWAR
jgi:hypothetical protein